MAGEAARRSDKAVMDETPPLEASPLNPVELDQLIHGRVRLGIASALAVHDTLSFPELRDLLGTTDGNLSVHARRLEDGGYLACTKSFEGRIPKTEFRLTPRGRAALGRYLDHMEALIEQVREP
jgi:DNA-binding MarR family transcriptional regulator